MNYNQENVTQSCIYCGTEIDTDKPICIIPFADNEMQYLKCEEQELTISAFADFSHEKVLEVEKFVIEIMARAIAIYPNKRIVELAAHSKKRRVRVKNIRKILRYYYELADSEF